VWVCCRSAGCYALLALPTGQLLAGGSDRCLRYWEPAWPERSYLVAGPLWQEDRPIVDSSSGKVNVSPPVCSSQQLQNPREHVAS
jgi:hypothetical protein